MAYSRRYPGGFVDLPSRTTEIDSEFLNNVEDALLRLEDVPAARVYHTANQSIAAATGTNLLFNTERFDTDTIHDTVTNNGRLTCQTTGKYLIIAQVRWEINATGNRQVAIIHNASVTIASNQLVAPTASIQDQQVATIWDLVVGEFVEANVYQSSGGALNIEAADYTPSLMMARIA